LAIVVKRFPATRAEFNLELAKAFLQLVLVTGVGGIVSALTDWFRSQRAAEEKRLEDRREAENRKQEEKRRDAERTLETARQAAEKERDFERRLAENRDEFLRGLLTRTMAGYANAKRARRLLRARGLTVPYPATLDGSGDVLLEAYDQQLERVNDAQLEFEDVIKEIGNNRGAFSQPQQLIDALSAMEQYLGALISEYEKNRYLFAGAPPKRFLRDLSALRDFVGPSGGSRFKSIFAGDQSQALEQFRAELLQPKPERGQSSPVAMPRNAATGLSRGPAGFAAESTP
jgi:hypothetical protein